MCLTSLADEASKRHIGMCQQSGRWSCRIVAHQLSFFNETQSVTWNSWPRHNSNANGPCQSEAVTKTPPPSTLVLPRTLSMPLQSRPRVKKL